MLYDIASNSCLYINFWGVFSTFGEPLRQNYLIHWVNGSFLALGGYDSNDYCFCVHVSTPSELFVIVFLLLSKKSSSWKPPCFTLLSLKLAHYLSSFCHQLFTLTFPVPFSPLPTSCSHFSMCPEKSEFWSQSMTSNFCFLFLWNNYMKAGKYMKKLMNISENSIWFIVKLVVFVNHSLTRKIGYIADICKRRTLLQKKYNTGNRGAESQIGNGEIIQRLAIGSYHHHHFLLKKHRKVQHYCTGSTNVVSGRNNYNLVG